MTTLEPVNKRIPVKKHRLFIDELFKCNMNQTQAYINIYGASYEVSAANASRLLKNANISEEINNRLKEKAMSADEVLARLADEAKNNISDFLIPGTLDLDIEKIHQKGYLVKSITHTQHGPKIELYDAQAAKIHLGRALGIFTDKIEFSWQEKLPDGYSADEVQRQFAALLALASKNATDSND